MLILCYTKFYFPNLKDLQRHAQVAILYNQRGAFTHGFDNYLLLFSEAEKVVGWAKNHYLSSCLLPSVKGERMCLPRER